VCNCPIELPSGRRTGTSSIAQSSATLCSRCPAQRPAPVTAPQRGDHLGERPVTMVSREQAHWNKQLTAAAALLRATGKAQGQRLVVGAACRRPVESPPSRPCTLRPKLKPSRSERSTSGMGSYPLPWNCGAASPASPNSAKAREQARAIAGWTPLPPRPAPRPGKRKAASWMASGSIRLGDVAARRPGGEGAQTKGAAFTDATLSQKITWQLRAYALRHSGAQSAITEASSRPICSGSASLAWRFSRGWTRKSRPVSNGYQLGRP
jgi:hypothetical protein